jgi:hypothetical protein
LGRLFELEAQRDQERLDALERGEPLPEPDSVLACKINTARWLVEHAQQAIINHEWTREVTIERRDAWAAWVRSFDGAPISPQAIDEQIRKQGFLPIRLEYQLLRHGLTY